MAAPPSLLHGLFPQYQSALTMIDKDRGSLRFAIMSTTLKGQDKLAANIEIFTLITSSSLCS